MHPPSAHPPAARKVRTPGERAADAVAGVVGSWWFILIQSGILLVWVALNVTGAVSPWDPYPFIFMNLVLSLQAAYTAPVIMMSQNREAAFDRRRAELDYRVNRKAEDEVRQIMAHLERQDAMLHELLAEVARLKK